MLASLAVSLLLASAAWATPLLQPGPLEDAHIVARSNTSAVDKWGNFYNYWLKTDTAWDLTRFGSGNPKTIPTIGDLPIIIAPERSALVIIDMQNFFLHPSLVKTSVGRDIVPATVNMVEGFRTAGMPVLWTFWGLDDFDLLNMPPAFLRGFSSDNTSKTTFGSEMGMLGDIDMGRKLWRGSWNAQPWGPLLPLQLDGVKAGTDFYFNKNRLSGLWGAQTPLGLFLQEQGITTLFFGGVNADQCVWGTFLDAYYKGFDVVFVEDISATSSPFFAEQMVHFNGAGDGFLANSTDILPALLK